MFIIKYGMCVQSKESVVLICNQVHLAYFVTKNRYKICVYL